MHRGGPCASDTRKDRPRGPLVGRPSPGTPAGRCRGWPTARGRCRGTTVEPAGEERLRVGWCNAVLVGGPHRVMSAAPPGPPRYEAGRPTPAGSGAPHPPFGGADGR